MWLNDLQRFSVKIKDMDDKKFADHGTTYILRRLGTLRSLIRVNEGGSKSSFVRLSRMYVIPFSATYIFAEFPKNSSIFSWLKKHELTFQVSDRIYQAQAKLLLQIPMIRFWQIAPLSVKMVGKDTEPPLKSPKKQLIGSLQTVRNKVLNEPRNFEVLEVSANTITVKLNQSKEELHLLAGEKINDVSLQRTSDSKSLSLPMVVQNFRVFEESESDGTNKPTVQKKIICRLNIDQGDSPSLKKFLGIES